MAEENSSAARARRSRHLQEELREEILVRLPAKSVTRFESVCKTWRSKFNSRPFIDLYGIRRCDGDSKYSLEFYTAPDLRKMVPGMRKTLLPPNSNPEVCWRRVICVFGPLSNGIYLLTTHIREEFGDFFSILSGEIVLCNPSICHYKVTNPFPFDLCYLLSRILLVLNPCQAHFGFGKINSSADYKVVVLISYGKSLSSFISLVYSLQSGEWKKIVEYERGKRIVGDRKATEAFNIQGRRIINICVPLEPRPQRFLEGCWHWVAIGEDRSFNVLSFNFSDEAFNLIGGPPPHMDYVTNQRCDTKPAVFVLHERLAVIYLHSALSHCVEVGVWMMMEYGNEESWTRVYKINPNFSGKFERFLGIEYSPLRDEESGSIRIESLSFSDGNNQQIICSNDAGYQVRGHWDSTMTPGISTYIETLERL